MNLGDGFLQIDDSVVAVDEQGLLIALGGIVLLHFVQQIIHCVFPVDYVLEFGDAHWKRFEHDRDMFWVVSLVVLTDQLLLLQGLLVEFQKASVLTHLITIFPPRFDPNSLFLLFFGQSTFLPSLSPPSFPPSLVFSLFSFGDPLWDCLGFRVEVLFI